MNTGVNLGAIYTVTPYIEEWALPWVGESGFIDCNQLRYLMPPDGFIQSGEWKFALAGKSASQRKSIIGEAVESGLLVSAGRDGWVEHIVDYLKQRNLDSSYTAGFILTKLKSYLTFVDEYGFAVNTEQAHSAYEQYLRQHRIGADALSDGVYKDRWTAIRNAQREIAGNTDGFSPFNPVKVRRTAPSTEAYAADDYERIVQALILLCESYHNAIDELADKAPEYLLTRVGVRSTHKPTVTINATGKDGYPVQVSRPLTGQVVSQWMACAAFVFGMYQGANAGSIYRMRVPEHDSKEKFFQDYVEKKRAGRVIRIAIYDASEELEEVELEYSAYKWLDRFISLRKKVLSVTGSTMETLFFAVNPARSPHFRPLSEGNISTFKTQYLDVFNKLELPSITHRRLRTTSVQLAKVRGGFDDAAVAQRHGHTVEVSKESYRDPGQAVSNQELTVGTMVLEKFVQHEESSDIVVRTIRDSVADDYSITFLTPEEATDKHIKPNITGLSCQNKETKEKSEYIRLKAAAGTATDVCADYNSCWSCPNQVMIADAKSAYLLMCHRDYLEANEELYLPYRLKDKDTQLVLDKIEMWLDRLEPSIVAKAKKIFDQEGNFFDMGLEGDSY